MLFNRILIAEDLPTIGFGLETLINQYKISENITITHYCDDALLKIRAAIQKNEPYDLLITDLSFVPGHIAAKIQSGEKLIEAIRDMEIEIKIIVFSVESRLGLIHRLYENYKIDAFVEKGRGVKEDFPKACNAIATNKIYKSIAIKNLFKKTENLSEIDNLDTIVLSLSAQGFRQKEIADHLAKNNYKISSVRAVEERVTKLKSIFEVKTLAHLIAIAKDQGMI